MLGRIFSGESQSLIARASVNPDGAGAVTYQWQRETSPGVWEDIDGADGTTYALAQDDVGHAGSLLCRGLSS